MDIVVGTAGHIDHGKTALVKALTGVDTDRLPEEKQRGITIDLGFADVTLGEVHLGFVDVPGHERFVKNMLAGACGIDVVMLVVAADEGVMPQTREHFDICRLLDVPSGLVVLTKKDLVDEETLDIARLQIAELAAVSFLENAPVIAASSRTSEGLDELRDALTALGKNVLRRNDRYVTRLPIDRSFSVKGFGAVVTGTLASGSIAGADELELLPVGRIVRVRGLQTHGSSVKHVHSGQRTAVNLGGIDHGDIVRGMVLAEKNALRSTQVIDAKIDMLASAEHSLMSRQRVRVHIGTAEILARAAVLNDTGEIEAGQQGLVQLRLESPVVAVPGERLILRSYSPQTTIAGGAVLDPLSTRHKKKEILSARSFLSRLEGALNDPVELVQVLTDSSGESGLTLPELQARTGLRTEVLNQALERNIEKRSLLAAGGTLISTQNFRVLIEATVARIQSHHRDEPLLKGISRETLREQLFAHTGSEVFKHVLGDLERVGKISIEKDTLSITAAAPQLSAQETIVQDRLRKTYTEAELEVPRLADALKVSTKDTQLRPDNARKIFQLLLEAGEIVKVTDEFFFSRSALNNVIEKLRAFAGKTSDRLIDVPKFKEIAGVSRKYAIPLLEYLDREKITRRSGDKRYIL
ncbi:MAG: selenocysteine-specific translation elongation factor [Acidobacteriota bacterium]